MEVATDYREVDIISNLYDDLAEGRMSLVDITWNQHLFHEKRRWSAAEFVSGVDIDALSDAEKVYIWNAGRAELTTKPGADRVARLADSECRRWQGVDDRLAAVMQSCGTWSRYWNEEEAFHETVFNALARRLGLEPITNDTFIEFRQIFPDDDLLRTLFLLVISEITAMVNYLCCARLANDAMLRALFKQVAADEAQHMRYFISFAKALVDSGHYPPKDAFAIAHLFLRDDGELSGSKRERVEARGTHVNWWDNLDTGSIEIPDDTEAKQKAIYSALKRVTGIDVDSPDEVEDTWMEMVGS